MHTPRPAAARERLTFIDGLRGLAMLAVLVYHCGFSDAYLRVPLPHGQWQLRVNAPLQFGYLGVHLFLVLSGFCLTYPLARDAAKGMRMELLRFFRRRAQRILPAYYAALALFTMRPILERALFPHSRPSGTSAHPYTAAAIVSHICLIHNMSPAWNLQINAAFWTLALEWQLYLVFPLLVWGLRRSGPAMTLVIVLGLSLAYRTWIYVNGHLFFANAMPGRIFEFVLGMVAAVAITGTWEAPKALGTRQYTLGALAFGALAFCAHQWWSPSSPITDILWGLCFFSLLMYGGRRSAAGGGWLDSRPLGALGLISYSVYLTHLGVVALAQVLVPRFHLTPGVTLLLFELLVAPLAIGGGWLFFQVVELRFCGISKQDGGESVQKGVAGGSSRCTEWN